MASPTSAVATGAFFTGPFVPSNEFNGVVEGYRFNASGESGSGYYRDEGAILCVSSSSDAGMVPEETVMKSLPPTRPKTRPLYALISSGYLGSKYDSAEHLEQGSKLGMLFLSVTNYLLARSKQDHRWRRVKESANKFNLLLGGACADGIPFKRLSSGATQNSTRLLNFYRGFQLICRKAMLVSTLRNFCATAQVPFPDFVPQSFLFFPAKEEQSEWDAFRGAFEARKERIGAAKNLWILKPSDGAKGKHIVVLDTEERIREHVEGQKKGSIAWVVQEYIVSPLLLSGRRKFDIRCWVLLDHEYDAWLYKEGVLRTTSTAFTISPESLNDPFVHLSNHCIQTGHADYGKYEATNEMFFPAFAEYLTNDLHLPADTLSAKIIPQIQAIVAFTVEAARDQMENLPYGPYKSFNVFGYDFMVDDALKVHLIEINSSPALADELLPAFTEELVHKAIDPLFPVAMPSASTQCSDCWLHCRR
jgi:tubulin---tyrosine ligase|eukprot:Stramenopile-MAST_4_protein_2434